MIAVIGFVLGIILAFSPLTFFGICLVGFVLFMVLGFICSTLELIVKVYKWYRC